DEGALLFNNDDEIKSLCEVGEFLPADRPDAGNLEQPQAKVIAFNLVNAEFVEGLTHVEIGFPGGDDADLGRPSTRRDDLVELVGAHEGQHGVALEVVQARFLAEESICQPDVQAARRHREIGWRDDLYAP